MHLFSLPTSARDSSRSTENFSNNCWETLTKPALLESSLAIPFLILFHGKQHAQTLRCGLVSKAGFSHPKSAQFIKEGRPRSNCVRLREAQVPQKHKAAAATLTYGVMRQLSGEFGT